MVGHFAVLADQMEVELAVVGEGAKELAYEFRLEITEILDLELDVEIEIAAPREIYGGQHERVVERHERITVALDPALLAERVVDRLAQRDPHVLHQVVVIHPVAAGAHAQAAP